ncbi:MAG TPA: hypothetical protein DD417_18275 [Elusimicrobia bacterium]|nr:hypothetical protein [Elusimicrobiota bacterium]
MKTIAAIERLLMSGERAFLIALVVVMVALSFLQVVLRSFFSAGLLWGDTFLRSLVLWVGFLGAALAAAEDRQFSMDALLRLLNGRTRAVVELVVHSFTAAVCWFLILASWSFFLGEFESGGTLFSIGAHEVPAWPFETILPLGFALLLLHYVLKAVLAVHAAVTGAVKPPSTEYPAP